MGRRRLAGATSPTLPQTRIAPDSIRCRIVSVTNCKNCLQKLWFLKSLGGGFALSYLTPKNDPNYFMTRRSFIHLLLRDIDHFIKSSDRNIWIKKSRRTGPNLILPFSPRGQRIWSTSVFFKCVSFPSYATLWDKENRMKSQTCWTICPDRIFVSVFFFAFPLTPPRGTRRTLPTQSPIGPQPIFPFYLYATSWDRAEVPDILPNRSPTDISFLHHLVVHFISPFSLFFFTPPRGTEQKSPTHCSKRSPTDLCFLFLSFSYTTPRGTFWFFFFLLFRPPRSTEQKFLTPC